MAAALAAQLAAAIAARDAVLEEAASLVFADQQRLLYDSESFCTAGRDWTAHIQCWLPTAPSCPAG